MVVVTASDRLRLEKRHENERKQEEQGTTRNESNASLGDALVAWNRLSSLSHDVGTHVIQSKIVSVRNRRRRARTEVTEDKEAGVKITDDVGRTNKKKRLSATQKEGDDLDNQHQQQQNTLLINDARLDSLPQPIQKEAENLKRMVTMFLKIQQLQKAFHKELIDIASEESRSRVEDVHQCVIDNANSMGRQRQAPTE